MSEHATITFRGKIKQVYNMDERPAFREIRVPAFTRSHCDMDAFRKHPRYRDLANSDLFTNVLARIRRDVLGSDYHNTLRMDRLPENVQVQENEFLATVTITV